MNWLQRLVIGVVPRAWGEAIEAESREWTFRCFECRHERSLWDMGGMRWKSNKPTQRYRTWCPKCGRRTWHTLARRIDGE